MKKYSKKNKLVLLLILVLMISVGYAAIATTLKINGTSIAKGQGWSVFWSNVNVTEGSVTGTNVTNAPTTVGTTTTEVEFAVTLPEPGDYYEFTIDAVNAGTIDAMIAENGILNKVYSDSGYTTETTLPKALNYTITYADGTEIAAKHLLAKKSGNTPTTQKYKVRVEYRNDEEINPSDLDKDNDKTYYFKFEVTYVQADSTATDVNPVNVITYVKRQTEGQITPGDIIRIGNNEEFYVINSNSTKTALLSKYNLLVGNIVEDYSITGTYSESNEGYGMQSSEVVGFVDAGGSYKGSTSFSSTNYWDNNDTLISPYNANGASYSGSPYPYVYDENSSIYQYISGENGYVNKLKQTGAPSTITGRLLSYEEADSAKTVKDNGTSIINNGSSYWLGSAARSNNIWTVGSNSNDFLRNSPNMATFGGVRPVIEIPTSEIK